MTSSEESHQRALAEGLYAMYCDRILTDVILEAGHEEIHCHRNVLAAASPYFRAMFTSPVRERDQKKIHIRDIAAHVLKAVIGYIYTGKILLTNENVQDLIISANMLEMNNLIGRCADHMAEELCVSNCVELYRFASHFACNRLKQSSRAYILDHFSDVAKEGDELNTLDVDQMEDMISSDDLGVDREGTVYDIVVKWSQVEGRDRHFARLFKCIRLPLLDDNCITNHILNNPLVYTDADCKYLLDLNKLRKEQRSSEINETDMEVAGYHFRDLTDTELNATPRHGMFNRTMLVFSGGANGTEERSLTAFDPVTFKNFTALKPHPTFDFKFKVDYYQLVSTVRNDILFIGGIFYDNHHFEDHGEALRDVFMYNMKEIKWEKKACMNTARCCFSVSVHNDSVYAIGGKSTFPRGDPTDSVELYNVELDRWLPVSSLPIKLYSHSSCTAKDAIFVFGGKDEDDDFLDTVFRYDITTDSWTLVTTQMPKPRDRLSSFYFKGNIYLVGGTTLHENILTVSIYNPDRNKWSHGTDFPEERKVVAATIHEGNIFLCGGVRHLGLSGRRSRQVESRDLYKYDIAKDSWTKLVKLVQYGNTQSLTVAVLNTKYLEESDFISTI